MQRWQNNKQNQIATTLILDESSGLGSDIVCCLNDHYIYNYNLDRFYYYQPFFIITIGTIQITLITSGIIYQAPNRLLLFAFLPQVFQFASQRDGQGA
jgi:hypothetical protein